MSFTELDDLDDDDTELDLQNGESAEQVIARLRQVSRQRGKALKDLEKKAAKGEDAAKELAFIKAKLPDTPQVQFFLEHYKGDYDSEAIRTAAAQHGFIEADQTVEGEVNQVEEFMTANSGGVKPAAPGSDDAMMKEINAVTATGPEAAAKIEKIMEKYGRLQVDE